MSEHESHGEHGHDVTIIVNGQEKVWTEHEISYEQLVDLAYPVPPTGNDIGFEITYFDSEHEHKPGTLVAGQSVKVKKDMVFNVTPTTKS